MSSQTDELLERLRALAWNQSIPFCYSCFREAPSGRCAMCGSDDLMRLVPGVGCEWGIEWVMRHLLEANVPAAGVDEAFEESIAACYSETVQVGWLTLDVVETIKRIDPISWDLAKDEWLDAELKEGNLITLDSGGTYYTAYEVERYLDEAEDANATS